MRKHVAFRIARGPHAAMSGDHYSSDPESFAAGMRAALPHQVVQDWGVTIEIRERKEEKKGDWDKPGRLVKKIV